MNIPLDPAPKASAVPKDPFVAYSASVLEIIPDVESGHLRKLFEEYHPLHGEKVVEMILHVLFEDPSYPRSENATKKRKRSRDDDGERDKGKMRTSASVGEATDYGSANRDFAGGEHYASLAITQLQVDFPFIPKGHIRAVLSSNKELYAPTYLYLAYEIETGDLPYKKKRAISRVKGKDRQLYDEEFNKERDWLANHLASVKTANPTEGDHGSDDGECEDGIECGCCFSTFSFDKMVQCPEAHLFCRSCCRSYAANKLGEHDHRLRCMDQSGCKELFPESELARMLPKKLMDLYHRLKQQKEIEAAGLEGLEECPFCEYKVVIENSEEKLFRCEGEDCGVVSCRTCKKVDHLPKSCKEAQDDKHLDVRHAIEEAMTKALMRNCPKCSKAFIKENGCNKMTCPICNTLSCYICRQIIVGYDHFNNPPPYVGRSDKKKCPLWDPVEQRHDNEVRVAAEKAIAEFKAQNPDVPEEALKVDIPKPVAVNQAPLVYGPQRVFGLPRGVLVPPWPNAGPAVNGGNAQVYGHAREQMQAQMQAQQARAHMQAQMQAQAQAQAQVQMRRQEHAQAQTRMELHILQARQAQQANERIQRLQARQVRQAAVQANPVPAHGMQAAAHVRQQAMQRAQVAQAQAQVQVAAAVGAGAAQRQYIG
ncbi:hypothetical protein BU17DRAFT_51893 [Hysterangium stoloniferum]|nr:hypothetical protein BU17DRAFT_51893 [Hysterangium stoloniferum]